MPTYSYQCESCNHEQDHSCRFSNRPDTLECSKCGKTSNLYMCKDCNHKFDEIIDFSKGQHFEDKQKCPKCSSMNSKWVPMARIDRFSEQFPYYDRGLGVMLRSKQHRRDICKQRGLTPVDGDWNIEKEYSKWDDRMEKEIKEYEDYCDRLDNHPAFRQHREALDKQNRR